MACGLFPAAALALLVVCSDSLRADPLVSAAKERAHVGRGSIAAGDAHTVMATPDGRVFAWGAGDRGQLGHGAIGDRWLPTLIPGLSGIVTVSAGRAHSVAVSGAGEVFAWGATMRTDASVMARKRCG
jgi:alpha-tubulin suppressor-like RCC1 family protein